MQENKQQTCQSALCSNPAEFVLRRPNKRDLLLCNRCGRVWLKFDGLTVDAKYEVYRLKGDVFAERKVNVDEKT